MIDASAYCFPMVDSVTHEKIRTLQCRTFKWMNVTRMTLMMGHWMTFWSVVNMQLGDEEQD